MPAFSPPPLLLFLFFFVWCTRPIQGVEPTVLVRTFLKRCGRTGLCKDPLQGDYWWAPSVSPLGTPFALTCTNDRPFPGGLSLQCELRRGGGKEEKEEEEGGSNTTSTRYRYCCENRLTHMNRSIVEQNSCVDLDGPGLWQETSTAVDGFIPAFGSDTCYMLVSVVEEGDLPSAYSPSSSSASTTTTAVSAASPLVEIAIARKKLRGTGPLRDPMEGQGQTPGTTSLVTFKLPRVDAMVLDYCMVDTEGTFLDGDSCGVEVAQRFCRLHKGCYGAENQHKASQPVPGPYFALMSPSSGPHKQQPDTRAGYPFVQDPYRHTFQSITCRCPYFPNSRAPVKYRDPKHKGYRIDYCNNWNINNEPVNCGQAAADEWCQRMELTRSLSFTRENLNTTTYILGDGQTNEADKGQDGFSSIICGY